MTDGDESDVSVTSSDDGEGVRNDVEHTNNTKNGQMPGTTPGQSSGLVSLLFNSSEIPTSNS